MQVFNQINARKLKENEFNVFSEMFRNPMFIGITILTILIQMLMVQFGGKAVKSYPLSLRQNGYCLLIGAGELFWGVFIKCLPVKWFQCVRLDEKPMTDDEKASGIMSKLRQSSLRPGAS